MDAHPEASAWAGSEQGSAAAPAEAAMEHVEVLIVGAGLSGIDTAYRLKTAAPSWPFLILEGRASMGGTWDLFRYPGVRSDSDMYTLGYPFLPWKEARSIADGPSILRYLQQATATFGLTEHIRLGHRVIRADWDSRRGRWRVEVKRSDGNRVAFTCCFLYMCSGYYDDASAYVPAFAGQERYAGQIIQPQFWPEDLALGGRQVIVIGSGATAVTLVPALAKQAARVTMLQRSPTYIVSRPSRDAWANWLSRRLPGALAHPLARWTNVVVSWFFYTLARRRPEKTRQAIMAMVQQQLGPDFDVATHFTPRYEPWDQRLCLAPDGDFFAALRSGQATVVTDEISHFTATGIALVSGRELHADVIVMATGLNLRVLGGVTLKVDGVPIDLSRCLTYKGMMYSDVPNLAFAFGYTNASWTLKCDLTARAVCRLLNYMRRRGYQRCVARLRQPVAVESALPLSSGYVQRAAAQLPKQGTRAPWKTYQNYFRDLFSLQAPINDGVMQFARLGDAQPLRAQHDMHGN